MIDLWLMFGLGFGSGAVATAIVFLRGASKHLDLRPWDPDDPRRKCICGLRHRPGICDGGR